MDFFELIWEPNSAAFSLFGMRHLLILCLSTGIIFALLHWITAQSPQGQERSLRVLAVLVPCLELSHAVWLYLGGVTQVWKLLPLHLCGMQSFFIPLAVFTRKIYWEDYVYATSVLGGVFALVFQSGVADYYPLWHFQTLQNVALHVLLIVIPVAMILTGRHLPDYHRFPVSVGIFLCVAGIAGIVDVIFGENYMFLMQPPMNTPLVGVYRYIGHCGYLVCAFVLLAGASFLTHLPFSLAVRARKRERQKNL